MKLRLSLLGVVVGIGLAGALHAQDTPKDHALAWNPYATAKAGDWAAYAMDDRGYASKHRDIQSVAKVDGDTATVEEYPCTGKVGDTDHKTWTFSTKDAFTIEKIFSDKENTVTVSDLATTEEKKTVGGREFACTKISCKASRDYAGHKGKFHFEGTLTVWLSKDVKAPGIVAYTREDVRKRGKSTGGTPPHDMSRDVEVVGFGNGDKTDWGTKAKALKGD